MFAVLPIQGAKAGTLEINGRVIDAVTDAPLIGATILLEQDSRGSATDRAGRFRIGRLAPGSHALLVRYVGYQATRLEVIVPQTGEIIIRLDPALLESEEVIVTASPTGSAISYQPNQAFSIDQLQRSLGNSIGEMLDGQPGVAMRSFGPAPARPVIRGLDGDRVLVIQNGERMGDLAETAADHAVTIDPLALERVEVVRGPASLLYGSSALGGVVHLFSNDVPLTWSRGTSGGFAFQGSTMNNSGAAFGRFAAGGERAAFTGRLSYRGGGNTATPAGVLPGTFLRDLNGSAGAGFHGSRLRGGAAMSFLDRRYGLPEALDDPFEDIEIRMDRQSLEGRLQWQPGAVFEDVEWRFSGSRYFHEEIEIETLDDGMLLEDVELSFLQQALSTTVTARHRPLGPFRNGAVGASSFVRFLHVGGAEMLTPDARSAHFAFFLFEEMPLSHAVMIQAGARIEQQAMRAVPNEQFPDAAMKRDATIFSGSLGLNFRPAKQFEIGAQAARAHRAPSVEELFADAPHLGVAAYEIGNPDLRNEIGYGADVFARWRSRSLRFEAAGFYNRIDNFVIRRPTGEIHDESGFPVFEFEGDNALLVGGELSVDASIGRWLISSSADYVAGSRRDVDRTPLPFMPPLRGRLAVTFDEQSWWLGSAVRLVSAQNRVAGEENPTDGYVLVNAEAGLRLHQGGRHVITLRLDNLLNTTYRDHLSRVEDRNFPMPGRNANLSYRWLF